MLKTREKAFFFFGKNIHGKGYSFTVSQTVVMYRSSHVLFRTTDNHKILLIKLFFAEQTEVSGSQGLQEMWSRLADVSWQHGFSPFWFYEVREEENVLFGLLCVLIASLTYCDNLLVSSFLVPNENCLFYQDSISDRGKSSSLASWIRCKKKCDP